MAFVEPVTLSARGIALVPLALAHENGEKKSTIYNPYIAKLRSFS